jgi:hypothetical protein
VCYSGGVIATGQIVSRLFHGVGGGHRLLFPVAATAAERQSGSSAHSKGRKAVPVDFQITVTESVVNRLRAQTSS